LLFRSGRANARTARREIEQMTITHALILIFGVTIGYLASAFRNPICAWEAMSDTCKTGQLVLGHRFVERERNVDATVQVLQCERCEKYHIGWSRK
jgi:hypothetical protein